MSKILKKFTVLDLMIMASMASIGVAIKPIIAPIVQIINAPLLIPGGAVAGGIYMMWMIIGGLIVKKPYTSTIIAFVQALVVILTGVIGGHGVLTLLTYTFPGVLIDIVLFLNKNKEDEKLKCFFSGILSNLGGTFLTSVIFYKLPLIPLVLSLSASMLSGALGGLIAYNIYQKLNKSNLLN